ncbi:MAG: hypothetical protein NTV33_12625 [Coprothermobacterota bacterium]|nr:hypothetical protein [Coprothermobacterota bacterium]
MAPQCGISSTQTEANRSREQPTRGWFSHGYLSHFNTERPAGGYLAAGGYRVAGGYLAAGGYRVAGGCRAAGGCLVEPLVGFFLGRLYGRVRTMLPQAVQMRLGGSQNSPRQLDSPRQGVLPHWGATLPSQEEHTEQPPAA